MKYHGVNPTDTHIPDYERNTHLINIEPDLHRRHQSQDVTTLNHPMERRPHQDNDLLHLANDLLHLAYNKDTVSDN